MTYFQNFHLVYYVLMFTQDYMGDGCMLDKLYTIHVFIVQWVENLAVREAATRMYNV